MKRDFLEIYLTAFSESVISEIKKLWRSSFDSKCLKFNIPFKKAAKNLEKVHCLWDHCIWICIVNLSLWRTRYFSSAAIVFTSSPKIWHVHKRDFFRLNFFGSDRWIWSRCCNADYNSAWARLPCSLSNGPLKRDFLDIYLTTFSESVISKIQKLWRSSFFSNCSKLNLDFENAAKNCEKKIFFSEIIIWIVIVKLSLLSTGYFSSAANVLTSSPKIWHVSQRDFFEHNFLDSDEGIW